MNKQLLQTKSLLGDALIQMSKSGYRITGEVSIAVDDKLPIMGYTTEKDGHPLIVVSGWSLASGRIEGLIIHELSHVYRIQSGHPSHSSTLHNKILRAVVGHRVVTAVQIETIQNTINNLQDLYADDISFAVYFNEKNDDLSEFFLGWIREPIMQPASDTEIWLNAGSLLNAAFASANLKRHNVKDRDGKVASAIEAFLIKNDQSLAREFDYFEKLMIELPDALTDTQFEKILTQYLEKFLLLCKA